MEIASTSEVNGIIEADVERMRAERWKDEFNSLYRQVKEIPKTLERCDYVRLQVDGNDLRLIDGKSYEVATAKLNKVMELMETIESHSKDASPYMALEDIVQLTKDIILNQTQIEGK